MRTFKFKYLPAAVSRLDEKLNNIERLIKDEAERTSINEKDLLNAREAAKFLKLSISTLYSKNSRGELPVMKPGGRLYYSKRELMDYIRSGRRKTNSDIQAEAHTHIKKKGGFNE